MTGTFYRDRQEEMLAEHRRQGHVLIAGTNLIDDAHLSALDRHIMSKASEEGLDELKAFWRETGARRRQAEGRAYVDGVLARHRAKVEQREALRMRLGRLRLRMALREMDEALSR